MQYQRIAICDDEKVSLIEVKKFLEKSLLTYGIEFEINIFQSAKQLRAQTEIQAFDIYFLDVDMPEVNGIDLAQEIHDRNKRALIVFVSAQERYVFQSFRAHPFSFVRKACFEKDMQQVIKDYVATLREQDEEKYCRIVDDAGYEHRFLIDEICYFEAKEKYVSVVLTEGEKLLRCSMKKLEKELETYEMVRCHKSYIVNLKKIYAVKYDHLIMLDGIQLPIRRGTVSELKKRLCSVLVQ